MFQEQCIYGLDDAFSFSVATQAKTFVGACQNHIIFIVAREIYDDFILNSCLIRLCHNRLYHVDE